jgi:hypothetical protein
METFYYFCLFTDLHCLSRDSFKNKLEKIWKKWSSRNIEVLFRHLPGETEEKTKYSSQDRQSSSEDLSRGPPKNKGCCAGHSGANIGFEKC